VTAFRAKSSSSTWTPFCPRLGSSPVRSTKTTFKQFLPKLVPKLGPVHGVSVRGKSGFRPVACLFWDQMNRRQPLGDRFNFPSHSVVAHGVGRCHVPVSDFYLVCVGVPCVGVRTRRHGCRRVSKIVRISLQRGGRKGESQGLDLCFIERPSPYNPRGI